MPFETSVTESIIRYLNMSPCGRAEKLKGSSSSSGKADINACYKGRSLRIEVKSTDHKNRTSDKQDHNLEKWYAAGAVVMVAYSREAFVAFLALLDKGVIGSHNWREPNGCMSWVKIPVLR